MENFVKKLGVTFGVIIIVLFFSIFGGTIVWLIWPVAIPAVFPGLVTSGAIAAKLTWIQSVCLTWIFSILIKSLQHNAKS